MNKVEVLIYRSLFLLLFLAAFTASACGQSDKVMAILESVAEGENLPDQAWLINIHGDTVSYPYFQGKWLIIDFWSAGCRPCIEEFPHLDRRYQEIDRSQLEVISIYVGKKPERWQRNLKKYDMDFPAYYGGWSAANPFLALNFKAAEDENGALRISTSTPQYVLIDPQGKIVSKSLPKPSSDQFEQLLTQHKLLMK